MTRSVVAERHGLEATVIDPHGGGTTHPRSFSRPTTPP